MQVVSRLKNGPVSQKAKKQNLMETKTKQFLHDQISTPA